MSKLVGIYNQTEKNRCPYNKQLKTLNNVPILPPQQHFNYRIPGKRPTFFASQTFNSPNWKVPASNIRMKKS